jgi:hypothetical protein
VDTAAASKRLWLQQVEQSLPCLLRHACCLQVLLLLQQLEERQPWVQQLCRGWLQQAAAAKATGKGISCSQHVQR